MEFSYGKGYPGIRHTFQVDGKWEKYTFDFTGPERPKEAWHFGHTFAFTGPGKLWMDNCRIFRTYAPDTAAAPLRAGRGRLPRADGLAAGRRAERGPPDLVPQP